jgi:predicted dehydrogenase
VKPTTNRRDFIKGAAGATALFSIVPRYVLGGPGFVPPSEKVNVAIIGAGGMGMRNTQALLNEPEARIAAVCDVAEETDLTAYWYRCRAGRKPVKALIEAAYAQATPNYRCAEYEDFRVLFEKEKGLDAVLCATPDHSHAFITITAMRLGKHVYCEKPLAHSVGEVRALMKAAQEHKVVTQLGNQGHSSNETRMLCEWLADGAVGKVHTVHACAKHVNTGLDRLVEARAGAPVPANLDWNLWLGPAQERAYSPAYAPHAWRGWVPFGNGTLGDWACHVLGPVFRGLDLGAPSTVATEVKDYPQELRGEVFPRGDVVTFEFPAKDKRGPITLTWHSGDAKMPRPPQLEPERQPVETGAVVYGDKGALMYGSHGAGGLRLIPEAAMQAYKRPEPTLPRVPRGGHEQDWARAIREGGASCSDFSVGGPLSEIALLGVIALRFAGQKLAWDGAAMRFTNCDAANAFVSPPYRQGWSL